MLKFFIFNYTLKIRNNHCSRGEMDIIAAFEAVVGGSNPSESAGSARRADKLLCLREDSKTAAVRDERVGEERREGRPAENFLEEKFICRRIPPKAQGTRP